MHHSFISLVTQLNSGPARLIENCLPNIFIDKCLGIHDATVHQQNCMRLLHLCYIDEYLLHIHLQLHEKALEAHSLSESHRLGYVDASFLEDDCGFGNLEHSEAHLGEDEGELSESSGLASAWATRQADPRDGELSAAGLTGFSKEQFFLKT